LQYEASVLNSWSSPDGPGPHIPSPQHFLQLLLWQLVLTHWSLYAHDAMQFLVQSSLQEFCVGLQVWPCASVHFFTPDTVLQWPLLHSESLEHVASHILSSPPSPPPLVPCR
jgi:hypothetical protein